MNPKMRENNPQLEQPPASGGYEKVRERAMEDRPDQESTVGKSQPVLTDTQIITSPPPVLISDLPAAEPPSLPTDQDSSSTDTHSGHSGNHLIEKQWVERAKAIVAETQDDPYRQKKEISKTGAQYIKNRFNKTIPTDDTVAV